MSKILTMAFLMVFGLSFANAQGVEDEIEFKYIKADYLLETERYEDAIKAFTQIIKENPKYKDSMLKRATAKYAMAAYKGVKNDIVDFVTTNGITEDAITLLGKAEFKMKNYDAAINSLTTATGNLNSDPEVYFFIGEIFNSKMEVLKACEYYTEAARLGSSKAAVKAKKNCGSTVVVANEKADQNRKKSKINVEDPGEIVSSSSGTPGGSAGKLKLPPRKNTPTDEGPMTDTDEGEEDVVVEEKKEEPKSELYKIPKEDDTPNDIEIDEDLSLTIYGMGLGRRKILDKPSILILSDEDGTVAVDLCVNENGKVESVEFNTELSTLSKKSLVSLALRKAKDFWFEKEDYKEQCGVMLFKIKGT